MEYFYRKSPSFINVISPGRHCIGCRNICVNFGAFWHDLARFIFTIEISLRIFNEFLNKIFRNEFQTWWRILVSAQVRDGPCDIAKKSDINSLLTNQVQKWTHASGVDHKVSVFRSITSYVAQCPHCLLADLQPIRFC